MEENENPNLNPDENPISQDPFFSQNENGNGNGNGNGNPFQSNDNFNFVDDGKKKKKKKGMGPLKGLLLAILIVFLICVVGLLIRMVIAGDGDYFKPIKAIFGIESKDDKKAPNKVESEKKSSLSAERYTLLNKDVEGKNVKHYRMTVGIDEVYEKLLDLYSGYQNNNSSSFDDSNDNDYSYDEDNDYSYDEDEDYSYDEDEDYNYNDGDGDTNLYFDDEEDTTQDSIFEQTMSLRTDDSIMNEEDEFNNEDEDMFYDEDNDLTDDEIYSDERLRSNVNADDEYGTDYLENEISSKIQEYSSQLGMMLGMMGDQIKEIIDGEIYFDYYFEGNEIVQVVMGVDYGDLIEKLYDFILDEAGDEVVEDMKSEGIESAKDLADYIVKNIEERFDEEELIDQMYDNEELKEGLSNYGLNKNNIEEAIDIRFDRGIFEFYLTGTTKINEIFSEYLESDEFKEEVETIEEEQNVKIDEDSVIEDMIKASNDTDEYKEFGMEFVEVK